VREISRNAAGPLALADPRVLHVHTSPQCCDSTMPRTIKKPATLLQWIEANIVLPDVVAEPGPLTLAPYMRQIADAVKLDRLARPPSFTPRACVYRKPKPEHNGDEAPPRIARDAMLPVG
jgi:hypothetical protein